MVSSTFYDLREIRQQIATFAEHQLGYDVLISESPAFPVDADADTIENCRRRVEQNADLLVLVIGKRYGYVEADSQRSVTNLEYLAARAKGVPIFTFVEKDALVLYNAWASTNTSTRTAIGSTVVNGAIFDFIHQVRVGDNVWTHGFEGAADIVDCLRQQLAYQMHVGLLIHRQLLGSPDRDFISSLSGRPFRIAVERPFAWEQRLFASILAQEFARTRDLRRSYELNVTFGQTTTVDEDRLPEWMQAQLQELLRLTANAETLVNEGLPAALGPEGEAGNAREIVFLARQVVTAYTEAMEWTLRIRRVHPRKPELGTPIKTLSSVSESLVVGLGDWVEHLEARMERLVRDRQAPGGSEKPLVDLGLKLSIPPDRLQQLVSQMEAAYGRRG
jgi:Domain of unknown function (DUF4062)